MLFLTRDFPIFTSSSSASCPVSGDSCPDGWLAQAPSTSFSLDTSFGRRGQRDFASVAFCQGLSVRPEVSSFSSHTFNSFVTLIHSPQYSSAWIAAAAVRQRAGYGFFSALISVGGIGGRRGFGLGGKSVPSPFFSSFSRNRSVQPLKLLE